MSIKSISIGIEIDTTGLKDYKPYYNAEMNDTRYTFILKNEEREIEWHFSTESRDEFLEEVEAFMYAAGFRFDGQLDFICNNENNS